MKIIRIITIITISLAALGWIGFTLASNKQQIDAQAQIKETVITEIPVRIATVEKRQINNHLALTGTFEARKELDIVAEGQGRITRLAIEEGQKVTKGQEIASIDNTSIQSQLATSKALLEKASKDVERYDRLLKAGAISQQQYEDVKLNLNNAQTNVTAIEQQLTYTQVRSPMTGFIKEIKVEQGSFAAPGATIATVVDITKLKLVVKVSETDIIKIRKGQKVSIHTEVYPDIIVEGTISLISIQADAARKYAVEIEVPNTGKYPLKAGMYGTAKIDLGAKIPEYGLFVPRKSILGSVKNAKVYIVQIDKSVTEKSVQLGEIVDDQVLVLSGLEEGEIVVTTGQINLEEGKQVKVLNAEVSNT